MRPIDADEIKRELARFRENLPLLIENELMQVQITRAKFLALVKEGFTEAQALELCRPK